MHGGEPWPVIWPAIHVLLVARLKKLNFAQLALLVELFDVQKLSGVDHRLHHHVFESGFLTQVDNRLAVFHRSRHGNGAGDVLTRLERSDGLGRVVRDGCVDVDGVDLWVLENILIAAVAFLHTEEIPDGVQILLVALANRMHVCLGMVLINGNELRSKS